MEERNTHELKAKQDNRRNKKKKKRCRRVKVSCVLEERTNLLHVFTLVYVFAYLFSLAAATV